MKKLALILLAVNSIFVNAQNVLEYVPESAECVISLDGRALTDKIGKKKIENSAAFLEIVQDFLFRGDSKGKISDLGIDLKNDFVFFFNASAR